jgi:hypothetical protein
MKVDAITKMAVQLRGDYQKTVRDFLDLQVRGSVEGASVIEQLRNALSVHGQAKPEALESGLTTLATSDLRPTLPHVRTRTLVIAGQNDRITVPGASRVLATALPNARFVEIRRAAHTPFLSHRKEFTAELERFLCAEEVEVGASDIVGTTDATAGHFEPAGKSAPKAVASGGGVASSAKKKRMKARARKKLQAASR